MGYSYFQMLIYQSFVYNNYNQILNFLMGNQAVQRFNPCSQIQLKRKNYLEKNKCQATKKTNNLQIYRSQNKQNPQQKCLFSVILKQKESFKQESVSTDFQLNKSYQLKSQNNISSSKKYQKSKSLVLESKVQQNQDKKIFIFDWDDTLFFSSELRVQKCSMDSIIIEKSVLISYDQTVTKILKYCLQIGDIYIVTNSRDGWVKRSSEIFLPKASQLILNQSRIKIKSSRPKLQALNKFRSLHNWKVVSFKQIIENVVAQLESRDLDSKVLHLICVGDSQQQIVAARQIYEQYHLSFDNLYIKTIKLQNLPNIIDLIEQHELLLNNLQMVVNANKKLTIRMSRTQKIKTISN